MIADNRPRVDNRSLRGAWALSMRHEAMFAATLRKITERLIDGRFKSIIEQGLDNSSSAKAIIEKLPFFDRRNPDTFAFWREIADQITVAYETVVLETIDNEITRRGWVFEVQKTQDPKTIATFIKRIALSLAVDLSKKERNRILSVLRRVFSRNRTIPKNLARELIFRGVGITTKQQAIVTRKVERLIANGVSRSAALRAGRETATRFRQIRAAAISRTETAHALNYGLRESWRQAERQGALPPGTKKKWLRFEDERSSEICEELENHEPIGLDEDFNGGGFVGQGPPAHPNCRSTLELVFPE